MSDASSCAALAHAWLAAFNAHDVDALVELYDPHCTHTSPKIRAAHPETGGKIVGKDALCAWWSGAIARIPSLRYESTAIVATIGCVIIEYVRHADGEPDMPVAEAFDVREGRIIASRVYHG